MRNEDDALDAIQDTIMKAVKTLNTLKENDREIIIMRYMEDMALKDISRQKNMPLGTVKSIVSRSLKKLRILLKGAN